MAQTGWYNTNKNRAYPFVPGTAGVVGGAPSLRNLPDGVVVDTGFVLSALTDYDDASDTVYLNKIVRQGDTFTFEFMSDAPRLNGVVIVFARALTSDEYAVEFADSGVAGLSESGSTSYEAGCDEPLWEGFLVTGHLTDLEELLPADGTLSRDGGGSTTVEPSLIQNLSRRYVTRLALANGDRTRVSAPPGCDDVVFPYDTGRLYVNARCLSGEVNVKPGYNVIVRQNVGDGTLTLLASVGAGEGQPCEQVTLFDGEVPPAGSTLLEGGLRCGEVLRSVNGTGGRQFELLAGRGVTVTAFPDEGRLVIDVNMSGLAICHDSLSRVSESCSF